jgi:hypothetical protein
MRTLVGRGGLWESPTNGQCTRKGGGVVTGKDLKDCSQRADTVASRQVLPFVRLRSR